MGRARTQQLENKAYIEWILTHPEFHASGLSVQEIYGMSREELLVVMSTLPALQTISDLVAEIKEVNEAWRIDRGRLLSSNPPMG